MLLLFLIGILATRPIYPIGDSSSLMQSGRYGWTVIDNRMTDQRWAPSSALLPNGKSAIIIGGYSYKYDACVASADLFNESEGLFRKSRSRLTYPRDFASASPLTDGKILVAGGYNTILGTLNTAEIYDPKSDTFELLKSRMSVGRELFTATNLPDGDILFAGGFDIRSRHTMSSAEIFDPGKMEFIPLINRMHNDRFGHASILLRDGRVLIVGGKHWRVGKADKPLSSAEIYDPVSKTFTFANNEMSTPRDRPSVVMDKDGKVYVFGGQNGSQGIKSIDVFNPETNTFNVLNAELTYDRMAHGQLLFKDGRVLIIGGWRPSINATTETSELFDLNTHKMTPGPALPDSSHDMACIEFSDGGVLIAGGKTVSNGNEASLDKGYFWFPQ